MQVYRGFFKRPIDFVASLTGLILISPLFLFVVLALAVSNRGKVFFIQPRPGKGGKVFRVIKFKTMNDKRDVDGNLLSDAQRLTKIGKFVRSTSMDELPQLINVLKGDMSLIGPRPLLVHHLLLFTQEQMRRHEVRPGITGWAQVNGRNHCKLSRKFEYDVWYVDNLSFALDLRIIVMTIKNVLVAKNVGKGAEDMGDVDDLGFARRIKELKQKGVIK